MFVRTGQTELKGYALRMASGNVFKKIFEFLFRVPEKALPFWDRRATARKKQSPTAREDKVQRACCEEVGNEKIILKFISVSNRK